MYLTSCIVIYSYNKSQRDALFLKFILDKELHMFRTCLLSIIRSLNTVYTATGICHASSVGCLLVWSGWSSTLTSLADANRTSMKIPIAVYTVLRLLMMDSRSLRNMWTSLSKINLRNSASRWLLL